MAARRGARYYALQAGEVHYRAEKACIRCGGYARFAKSAACVGCSPAKNKKARRARYDDPVRRAVVLAKNAETRRADPARARRWARNSSIRSKYGLEPEDVRRMLEEQDCLCAICRNVHLSGADAEPPVVDHCHATGKVRGLLCARCNHALGHLRDNPETARRAADYLERNQ